MADALLLTAYIDLKNNQLTVGLSRNVTDALTNETTLETRDIIGPLSTLNGVGDIRSNLVAWVKAQTGFTGTVDVSS